MSLKITASNFNTEVLQSTVPVVVDFYSDTCIPCKRMSPILAELEEQYAGKFNLYKINVNLSVNKKLSEQSGVLSAPTLLFFKGGCEQERKTGYVEKEALLTIINNLLEG